MARRGGYYKAEFPPLIPQDVKRPIYGQGGPHLAQRQSEMGDGESGGSPLSNVWWHSHDCHRLQPSLGRQRLRVDR